MLLEITVVAGPGADAGTGGGASPGALAPTELSITWPAGTPPIECSGRSLQHALVERWPGHSFTVASQYLEALQAGLMPLVNGAVVVAWPVGRRQSRLDNQALRDGSPSQNMQLAEGDNDNLDGAVAAVLAVISGPGAGAVFALHRGCYSLGRGRCRIQVADPSLSRHHGTLVVGAREITLRASVGSSGFSLRTRTASATASAEPVKGTVVLEIGHVVVCGSSTLELRFHDPVLSLSNGGTQLLDTAVLRPIVVPHPPGSTRNLAALAAAGCLPLMLGLVFALVTGSWMFLAFATTGAVAVLFPLFSGVKQRSTFRAAVEDAARQDADRRGRSFPDAGTLMIAAQIKPTSSPREPPEAPMALRLGTATQPAAVGVTPADPGFCAPLLPLLPLCVPLTAGPVSINGPATAVVSLLNYVLMQLDAAAIPVVLLGPANILPLPARFLPFTRLASSVPAAARALAELRRGSVAGARMRPVVLLLLDEPVDPRLRSEPGLLAVHFAIRGHNVPATAIDTATNFPSTTHPSRDVGAPSVVSTSSGGAESPAVEVAVVELRADANRLVGNFAAQEFIPDGVPPSVFDSYAHRRALCVAGTIGAADTADPRGSLAPNSLPPPDLCTVDSLVEQWKRSDGGPLLPIPLGQSSAGPTLFDFLHDGPHLLLGGTTGSGKSELLRTLVGSLAAVHSPADLQFVFIDFKGGAGLGGLLKLPHTASLITDLGGDEMDRTLASLRAELHHREAALATFEAADSDCYRESVRCGAPDAGQGDRIGQAMAHLVVVIDEFRVLVDQFPDAMAELMRIAAVGRSLGIHLVMATQRPQGALNADIRANVTSSICLRVQSSLDSTDVIGTGVAASIAVATPGRAYISRAGGPPQEFQSATLHLPPAVTGLIPSVEDASTLLRAPSVVSTGAALSASDVNALAQLMNEAWQRLDTPGCSFHAAPAVVAPQLPADVELMNAGNHEALFLGQVDVPQRQSLEPLLWNPELTSHFACVGTGSESASAVAVAVSQVLAANHSYGAHGGFTPRLVYLLDGDGSLGNFADSPWVGGYMRPDQLRTAAHLVRRLGQTAGASGQTLILGISDWGRWAAAFRSSPWHEAENGVTALIRFSQPRVVVIVGGGHELISAPFLPSIPNRIFLSFGSSSESTMLWPRLPQFTSVPGRGAIVGPVNNAVSVPGAESMHIAQLGKAPLLATTEEGTESHVASAGSSAASTLFVPGLPESISMTQLKYAISNEHPAPHSRSGAGTSVVIGLGGDGHQPVRMVLSPGTVLPVLGGPGSGKSSFIQALADLNGSSTDVNFYPDEATGLLWLDDAESLTSQDLQQVNDGLAAGMVLLAAFTWPGPALSSLPPTWGLRTAQQGIVIRPQRCSDGELFGVRLDTAGAEPPGRGVLLDRGERAWFQFPQPQKNPQDNSAIPRRIV